MDMSDAFIPGAPAEMGHDLAVRSIPQAGDPDEPIMVVRP